MILDSPELNCSVVFSLCCLRMSKKIDHFLRNLWRGERRISWFNVNQSTHFLSLIEMMLGESSTDSLFWDFPFALDQHVSSHTFSCNACSSDRFSGTFVLLRIEAMTNLLNPWEILTEDWEFSSLRRSHPNALWIYGNKSAPCRSITFHDVHPSQTYCTSIFWHHVPRFFCMNKTSSRLTSIVTIQHGRKFPIEHAYSHTVKKSNSYLNNRMTQKWLGRKNMNPMWKLLNKEVALGKPTFFLDHVYLGCTQRQCQTSKDIVDNHSTMFESRISAVRPEKLPFPQNLSTSSWYYDMDEHAKKCMKRYYELPNKTTEQLYTEFIPCIEYHRFKEEEMKLLENCQIFALISFWNAYTWHVLEELIFLW